MTISVKVSGNDFVGYTKITVQRSFLEACGHFSLTVSLVDKNGNPQFNDYPINVGDDIEILVNDQTFLTGFVDRCEGTMSAESNVIIFYGRDRTEDIVDSTLSAAQVKGFLGNTTLTKICESVISSLGITNINVNNLTGETISFENFQFSMPMEGEPAIQFLQKLAQSKGVFINTDGQGNLQIVRGQNETGQVQTKILAQVDANKNNVIRRSFSVDNSRRFNQYIGNSQQSLAQNTLSDEKPTINDLYNVRNGVNSSVDSKIRKSRILNFVSNLPLDQNQLSLRARWENSLRRSGAIHYSCMMQEFTYDGTNIWEPNTFVQVIDDYAQINANMLVNKVRFIQSTKNLEAHLQLVSADAYILQSELDQQQVQGQNLASGYLSDGNN